MLNLQERVKLNNIILQNSHFLKNGIIIEYKILEEILNLFTNLEEYRENQNDSNSINTNSNSESLEEGTEEVKTVDETFTKDND